METLDINILELILDNMPYYIWIKLMLTNKNMYAKITKIAKRKISKIENPIKYLRLADKCVSCYNNIHNVQTCDKECAEWTGRCTVCEILLCYNNEPDINRHRNYDYETPKCFACLLGRS